MKTQTNCRVLQQGENAITEAHQAWMKPVAGIIGGIASGLTGGMMGGGATKKTGSGAKDGAWLQGGS